MMPQLPPKHTTHAEPPDGGNGKGGEEHAADRAPRRGPLDIADLGTQLLVPPDALQRQRAGWAQAAQEHEQRATQLRQDAGLVQEDARELAALERELDALWRTPLGLLSEEEDRQRVKYLSGLITERRQRPAA